MRDQNCAGRQLPQGWKWARLGDVCKTRTGLRDPRNTPDQAFVYVDISSVDTVAKGIVSPKSLQGKDAPSRARKEIHAGDVIVSTTRPNLNAVALVPQELDGQVCSTGFCVLRPTEALTSELLFTYVQSAQFVEALSSLVTGALYPAVTDRQVLSQPIPLPPLSEQKRIASILDEQLAAVEKARRACEEQLEAAKALPAAYLRSVFDSSDARAWPRDTVGNLASLIMDGPHVTPTYVSCGVPFLTVRNIVGRQIDLSDVSYVSPEDHAEFSRRGKAERGDILYTKDGTLGVPCVVDTEMQFSYFVSVALIKPLRGRIDSRFLTFALESPEVLEQVKLLGAGAGLKHMVLKSINALSVPVPPMGAQRRIADMLGDCIRESNRLTTLIDAQRDMVDTLPQAVLRKAFNGEL